MLICSPPPNTIPETAASGLHVAGRAVGLLVTLLQVELFTLHKRGRIDRYILDFGERRSVYQK